MEEAEEQTGAGSEGLPWSRSNKVDNQLWASYFLSEPWSPINWERSVG